MRRRRPAPKLQDVLFSTCIYGILLLLGLAMLYPFWNALVVSFNNGADTSNGGLTLWPRVFTLDNYAVIFQDNNLLNAFFISLSRTLLGTAISIFFTSMLAYGLSRKELIGRKFYMLLCIITIYFGGGLIPTYLLMHDLGLLDNFLVLVLPGAVSVWNMIIFRTFFRGLPASLEEAAKIDGCNNLSTFFRIVVPISRPVFATLALFTAVTYWNAWFDASIYISSDNLLPMQTVLVNIINSTISVQQLLQLGGVASNIAQAHTVTHQSLVAAAMVVTSIPIIIVYPFIQKYFNKGVLIGSLKE